MGAAAGLHRHHTNGLAREELQNFLASQPLTEDNLAGRIRPVRLKDVLRQVQADRANLRHGRLLLMVTNTTTLAHQGRRGGVHPITAWTLRDRTAITTAIQSVRV